MGASSVIGRSQTSVKFTKPRTQHWTQIIFFANFKAIEQTFDEKWGNQELGTAMCHS